MKSKGITIWEQHVEKIVLAVAVLVCGAFVAMQFVGNPNAATIGGKTVSPGEVDGLLEEKARAISVRLSDDAASPISLPEVKPVADELLASLNDSLSPLEALTVPAYVQLPLAVVGQQFAVQAYNVPVVPVPDPIQFVQYADALTPEVVEVHADVLSAHFPGGQPYDLAYATIYGEFPIAALRDTFLNKTVDLAQIPAVWYGGGDPLILDVVIERGEVVGDQLTNIVTLDPIPGQYSFRPDFIESDKPLTTADRAYVIEQLLKPEIQREVIQPEFLATRRGSWQPLAVGDSIEDESAADADDPVLRLDRLIARQKTERNRVADRLAELGGPINEEEEGQTSGGDKPKGGSSGSSGGGSSGPGKGSGLTAPTGGGAAAAADERTKARRRQLSRQLRDLDSKIAKLEEERTRLAGAAAIEAETQDVSRDVIMVWGHDITVEPGRQYRYRMTIKVFNPFFARKLNLLPEQQHLADSIALASQPSAWCESVTIDPPVRLYATSATSAQGGLPGMSSTFGSASFEVFRFYDGLTWSETFSVQPGDRIGAVRDVNLRSADGSSKKFTIDFRTDWIVLDIIHNHEIEQSASTAGSSLARIVLMDLKTGEITEIRDPNSDRMSSARRSLKDEVELSKAAALGS